jgi:hypothetical protein
MKVVGFKKSISGRRWLTVILLAGLLLSCIKTERLGSVAYVEEALLPSKLAVLPPTFLPVTNSEPGEFPVQENSDKGRFISELARGVIHNQLAGKGYDMRILHLVDQSLGDDPWQEQPPQSLCEQLEVNGLVHIEIVSATMVTAVAYDMFKIKARIKLVNHLGDELGQWTDEASKRKISLPTSPVSVAATLASALLDESAKKQMRLVIYDWGWKVCQFMPDNPEGERLPEVVLVDTNVDKGTFALGDQIRVEITAEKELACSFDLGRFKNEIPMPYVGDSVYKGVYVVQEGDRSTNQLLQIRLSRPNGVKRIWQESGGTISLDGVPPPAPQRINVQVSRNGIRLNWALPRGEDLETFTVEKSETAVGEFKTVANPKNLQYLDGNVSQGNTYYYRIRAIDRAGNRSAYEKTVPVVMPFFDEVSLSGSLSGTLVSGIYRIEGPATISHGNVLEITAGSTISVAPHTDVQIEGNLQVNGSSRHPVVFDGKGWKGLVIGDLGQANIAFATMKGCNPCVTVDGGSVQLKAAELRGESGDGIVLQEDGNLEIDGIQASGFGRAIVVEDGKGSLQAGTVTGNGIGIDVLQGTLLLADSNIYENEFIDFCSQTKMVLDGNYLGTTKSRDLNVKGDVLVKSLLDAPFPHGRKIVFIDDTEISEKDLSKQFEDLKKKGVDAFTQRRFGDAHQALSQALAIKAEDDVYLYLAYTQSSLGEEEDMVKTLEEGIQIYPYEVRLYQVYVKYLVSIGEKEKAQTLLEKAEKMNPEDQNILFLRQYVADFGN